MLVPFTDDFLSSLNAGCKGDSKLLVPALLNELLDGGIVKTELVAELSPANFVKDGDSSSVELHPRKNINSKLEEAKEA